MVMVMWVTVVTTFLASISMYERVPVQGRVWGRDAHGVSLGVLYLSWPVPFLLPLLL